MPHSPELMPGDAAAPGDMALAHQRHWAKAGWLLLAGVVVLYLASVSRVWHASPDSALYLMLSDNLVEGRGYTLWGEPHRHAPPGYPLILAAQKSLGMSSFFWLNLGLVLMALTALGCIYLGLGTQVPPPMAAWIVGLLALSHAFHLNSVRLLSDIPFAMVLWCGIWLQLRTLKHGGRTLELGSLVLLASCAIRVVGLPVVLGSAVGMVLQPGAVSKRRAWANAAAIIVTIVGAGTAGAAFLLLAKSSQGAHNYLSNFGGWFRDGWLAAMVQPLEHGVETGAQLSILFTGQSNVALGWATALLWLPLLLGMAVCVRRGAWYGVCLTLAYLVPLLLLRPLLARYLLPVAPFLFWYLLEGIRFVVDRSLSWTVRGQRAVVLCGVVLLAVNMPKAVKLAYRVHVPKPRQLSVEEKDLRRAMAFIQAITGSNGRFLANKNDRRLAYETGRWSVPNAQRSVAYKGVSGRSLTEWVDEGVECVVLFARMPESKYKRIRQQVASCKRFEPLYTSQTMQVFATPAAVAAMPRDAVARIAGQFQDGNRR